MPADNTSNYAPKSPDLSSFYSARPTQPAPQQFHAPPNSHNTHARASEYKLEHPASDFAYAPPYAPLPPQTSIHDQRHEPDFHLTSHQQHQYLQAHPGQSPSPQKAAYGAQPALFAPPAYAHQFPPQAQYSAGIYAQPYASGPPEALPITHAQPHSTIEMPPRKAAAPPPAAPYIDPSPVKTKFPTARIKRIMQADEEVGKVAQQTPIAVGKALEMFMVQLVSKSADVAKEKGSKRVTAQMLKQVVETDDQWDFLRDIVGRVEQEKEGSKAKAKTESESEEEASEPKKKGRGGRRKKA
ncbi:DNA polymerase epsilon subunit C [Paramyrothecium foliicola]|nr:DNA polymerase epsilon subunit C [Paramyrothecium foliicola]